MKKSLLTPDQRFWDKVQFTDTCWVWVGGRDYHGYGSFTGEDGKRMSAHRWAWNRYVQELPTYPYGSRRVRTVAALAPARRVLDHLCRNPSCVRFDHLRLITDTENVRRYRPLTRDNMIH